MLVSLYGLFIRAPPSAFLLVSCFNRRGCCKPVTKQPCPVDASVSCLVSSR